MSMHKIPVITVDGPSGSGKGTICHALAEALGFRLLDSGALYRLTAVAADNKGIDLDDEEAVHRVAKSLDIYFAPSDHGVQVFLDGNNVTSEIRREKASMGSSKVAAYPLVRKALLGRQRDFLKPPGLVADGRDMGTTVFPNAVVKIFLTASAEERANRRYKQLIERGESANLDTLLKDIKARDVRDSERSASPLIPASDAVSIDCTQLSIDEVVNQVLSLVEERLKLD